MVKNEGCFGDLLLSKSAVYCYYHHYTNRHNNLIFDYFNL